MALTQAQWTALKADILAATDPECVALEADPGHPDLAFAVAVLYNLTASPDFWVWRTNIPTKEIRGVIVWAEYDALSVSKQNAFSFLVSNGTVDASQVNVRQGIQSIFAGAQQVGNRTALTDLSRRLASRVEKLLASGTGSTASPATMGFEVPLTYQDVLSAMAKG